MGQYEVTAPCAYIEDNKAVVHSRTGVVVELDDELAGALPGALRRVNAEPDVDGDPTPVVAEPAAEGETETVVEDAALADPPPDPEPVQEPLDAPDAKAPRPRRTRGADAESDGED